MRVVIFADEATKKELLALPFNGEAEPVWLSSHTDLPTEADAVVDLLFTNSPEHLQLLSTINSPLLILNAVEMLNDELPAHAIRINGWPGFLKRPVMEAASTNEHLQSMATELFRVLGRSTQWVPDVRGMVTPRIVSSVVNEAFFSLEEKIATTTDIDTAMKSGTNYPFGPFEWTELIGANRICQLLHLLSQEQPRYTPSLLLRQKALA